MANATKERVGIVGVGRMGFAMLGHLLKMLTPCCTLMIAGSLREKS